MEQQKLPRLTPEQLKAEVDYIEEITQRLSNPTPEMTRDILERIDRHFKAKRSKAAELLGAESAKTTTISPDALSREKR
jgi:hypothetical protein